MSLNNEFYAPQNYQPDIKRAYHNLSEKNSFTPHTGLNYPVYTRMCYAGDEFEINTGTLLQTLQPLNRPLLDCFELRLEYYFEPLRNLYGYMSNNSKESTQDIIENSPKWCAHLFGVDESRTTRYGLIGPGNDPNIDLYIPESVDFNMNYHIEKNSLFEMFGVPVGFTGSFFTDAGSFVSGGFPFVPNKFTNHYNVGDIVNIEPLLAYLDICRTYHFNTQLENAFYTIGTLGPYSDNGPGSFNIDTVFQSVGVKFLDDLFVELRYASKTRNFDSLISETDRSTDLTNFRSFLASWLTTCASNTGGFFPVQYRPDMWRNLLSNTNVYNVSVNTSGSMSLEELYEKNKVKKYADSIFYSGGRFKNLLRTVFGWRSDLDLDIPVLRAVQRYIIDPSNITAMATTQTDDGETTLGQKGSNVDKYNASGKSIKIKCDEPGYIMVIANITPLVSYSQGFNPFMLRLSHNDDWSPNFTNLSSQAVPRILYSALHNYSLYNGAIDDFNPDLEEVVGYNIAWFEERTAVNRTHGEFNEVDGLYSDMVLGRRYQTFWRSGSLDKTNYYSRFNLSPYVNPLEYNDIFAQSSITVPPWSLHCAFNIKALRPIGKHYKPSLE